MNTLQISLRRRSPALDSLRNALAAIQTTIASAFPRLSAAAGRDWRSLDERLLRDIGVSPVDAEIARLAQRNGVAEIDTQDAIAGRGLTAVQFARWTGAEANRS